MISWDYFLYWQCLRFPASLFYSYNNYDWDVFNGDVGKVVEVGTVGRKVVKKRNSALSERLRGYLAR